MHYKEVNACQTPCLHRLKRQEPRVHPEAIEFATISLDEHTKVIQASESTTSTLDPLPTKILK